MKPTQLLLTLILVAGGIFVYDALVVREPADPAPETIRQEPSVAPAPTPEAEELAPFPVLEGRGDDIWRSDIERRLEGLERSPDVAGRTESSAALEASGVPGVPAGESEDEVLDENGQPRKRRFTPKDVATFRALLETVERQRREEKTRRGMLDGLKKLGVELPEAQANKVVDLTVGLYRGFQAKTRGMPKGEEGRAQRLEIFRELRTTYADELYRVVPPDDAERIVEAIDRLSNRQPKDGR